MKMSRAILMAFLTAVLLTFAAFAAAAPVNITISAQKEITTVGKDKKVTITYESAETVKNGDIVVYTILCENTGQEPVKGVEIIDPVPGGTAYVSGSATNAGGKVSGITYSIDQGKAYAAPEKLTYKTTDSKGKAVEKLATSDMYTHIKWLVDSLPSGEKISVTFKAKVL